MSATIPLRGRGRPRKHPIVDDEDTPEDGGSSAGEVGKKKRHRNNAKSYSSQVHTLSFPVTERDEEIVECGTCHEKSTFRQFRIHNLTTHYNIARTTDEKDELDYRFYSRKLTEMGRLMKLQTFVCPTPNCDSRYKSALGLGYHLENCGKSVAEIRASYVTCEVCCKKYPKANINFHKKSHATPKPKTPVITPTTLPKRSSALKAKKVLKTIGRDSTETDESGDASLNVKQEVESDSDSDKDKGRPIKSEPMDDGNDSEVTDTGTSAGIPSTHEDISFHAHQSLTQEIESGVSMWDRPQRVFANPFQDLPVNPLISVDDENVRAYLPSHFTSLPFRTKTKQHIKVAKEKVVQFNSTDFHSLKLFDSEITDSVYGNNIIFVGGPVSAMSWHPSGKYLAVATLKNYSDKPNINALETNQTCIQIYTNPLAFETSAGIPSILSGLVLQFALGVENGFIHHLQWSSFWPSACEANSAAGLFPHEDFVGHLAFAGGDSSVSVVFLRKSYFDLECNVTCLEHLDSKVIFYKKTPEVRLQLHESSREEAGQCIKFDWHEKLEYVAAGYANGLVALFNMHTTSRLLRKVAENPENNSKTTELQPFWYIRAHTEPVTVAVFNPSNPRYLVTCSHDYFVKTWDVELRREMESKKIGMVLDGCWIRGWIHMVISTEYLNVNFQIGNYNALKFYQVGNSKGYSSCADLFNITSVSFFEGMVAEATEVGRVTIAYYDQFLRECDYDRNKKKKNTVDFSSVSVEKTRIKGTDDTEPKLVFNLLNSRRECFGSIPEPSKDDAENYVVFYNLVRINKIDWCPMGNQLATGYNSGFLTITPACFNDIFKNYR